MSSFNKVMLPREICDDYAAGMTMQQIASKHGATYSTVRQRLIDYGVNFRTKSQAAKLSTFDWSSHAQKIGKLPMPESAKEKLRAARLSAPATGYSLKPNGYYEFTKGQHKGRSIHRVVAEIKIGRPLKKDEVVHHKDRNKANNNPDNLEVMTRGEHTALHRKEGW